MSSPIRQLNVSGLGGVEDLAQRVLEFARDVQERLAGLPPLEVVEIETDGNDLPRYAGGQLADVIGVVRLQSRNLVTGDEVGQKAVAWIMSENPSQPGVYVTAVDGLGSELHSLRLLLVGRPESEVR